MPCYLTGSADGDRALHYEEALKEVTKLTRLLCEACDIIITEIDSEFEDLASDKLCKWYRKHEKIDTKRAEQEKRIKDRKKLKKKALAKLSKEEQEALDI